MGETYMLLPHRNRSSLTVGGCISATKDIAVTERGRKMATQCCAVAIPGACASESILSGLPFGWKEFRRGFLVLGPKQAPKR